METWDLSRELADDLFEQMKKWLWLAAKVIEMGEPVQLGISQSTKLLDEMWHTFILFTSDYRAFGDRYLGCYLNHRPTPRTEYDAQIEAYEQNPEQHMEHVTNEFSRQYALIYDLLGPETLIKWYAEYLDTFTDEFVQRIWRWSFSPYDTRVRERVRLPARA